MRNLSTRKPEVDDADQAFPENETAGEHDDGGLVVASVTLPNPVQHTAYRAGQGERWHVVHACDPNAID